jgi:hypothetical protein
MKPHIKLSIAAAFALLTAGFTPNFAYAQNNVVIVDPAGWSVEDTYWRTTYPTRPYYSSTRDYVVYEPAYRYGADLYTQYPGKRYEEMDMVQVKTGWMKVRGKSTLTWEEAEAASKDSFNRMYGNASKKGS